MTAQLTGISLFCCRVVDVSVLWGQAVPGLVDNNSNSTSFIAMPSLVDSSSFSTAFPPPPVLRTPSPNHMWGFWGPESQDNVKA
ncbi:hypothetical protein KOW79_001725 [Hemibagrus wyckioides]|uniref:Secreted protein n=1 Tax=Hemibagrus wyckioides TaxID=337641 RepID=A0A9D3P7U8_9TELE|nr:hypothetical protein KOW79_001725 [Hemibagrus wyckioides]